MYFLGIDIGSSSSKVVIIDENKNILARKARNLGTGTNGPDMVVAEALEEAGITEDQIVYTVATGYGRVTHTKADKQITEISCHGKGVAHLIPGARTIIDIGGQDAKVIKLTAQGNVDNFVMNEKCAAGTGRFLEVMARILNCSLDELSDLSMQSTEEVEISNTCTVFAESEVISQLAQGTAREDVAKGADNSITSRVAGLARRIGISPIVVMSGGVAMNESVVRSMEKHIGYDITVAPHPQTVGALGAALFALESFNKK
ncbi:MAG: 2-hydroxyglutaryl-CoA dehydratase [Clostridiales bacterium]|nr:2-hydroxyglutaryl-CoA dehydratase [Clostridiales bacterium]